MIDLIVQRAELPTVLARLIRLYVVSNPPVAARRRAEVYA